MFHPLTFLCVHWLSSVFAQSFFLHRYSAHRQFELSPIAEKAFYLLTYILQGPSFLVPRAYAALHYEHHLHSDTVLDPHSPWFHRNPLSMMKATLDRYEAYINREIPLPSALVGRVPQWEALDKIGDSWMSRIVWGLGFVALYWSFAPSKWWMLLLPIHWLMGPIHGAIVNWFGHKLGYRNFATPDKSRNTLVWDALTMGELFQNNHHRAPLRTNFAARWFEIDPTYLIIVGLRILGIVKPARVSEQDDSMQSAPASAF